MPLRDSLFIIKEDGVYRLSGEAGSFTVNLFDSSSICKAADTAAILNNQIYMYSDQGVVKVSDSGIEVISRPIENLLVPLAGYTNFSTGSWAVGYESDRAYILFTLTDSADDVATQAFRFNTFTSTWTKWDVSKTCGVVNPSDDKLYLGTGDINYVEKERKAFSRLDHADRSQALTIPAGGVDGTVLSLGGLFSLKPGDVFVQTQYLTIAQYHRLLRKLDDDIGVTDSDYYTTLRASYGDELGAKLTALCTKLNADAGVADSDYTSSGSTAFATIQTDFNTIAAKLNADAGVSAVNYPTSSGTVEYEVPVDSINTANSLITVSYEVPLIAGAITAYTRIISEVVWAPETFEDPSMLKQVREGTIMFETKAFTDATASFASDLSPGYEAIPFSGEGTGIYGLVIYGTGTWGGEGTSAPFRTYVPRNKQRCRWISGRFQHEAAFEKYAIFGLSWTYEGTSPRAYK
jgi:hypothetical protein